MPIHNGFVLTQDGTKNESWLQGSFAIFTDAGETGTVVDHCGFAVAGGILFHGMEHMNRGK